MAVAEAFEWDEQDDPFDDTWGEEIWRPEREPREDPIFVAEARKDLPKFPSIRPSQFTAFAFRMPADDGVGEFGNGYSRFSFEGRRHMLRIYDSPARRILLKTARQVEKSCCLDTRVLLADGSVKLAKDVAVDDVVATLDVPGGGARMTTGVVTWVSRRYRKPCVRLVTRQGHVCEVALTHPMRVWAGWLEAGQVRVGTRLAVVRKSGAFYNDRVPGVRHDTYPAEAAGCIQRIFTLCGEDGWRGVPLQTLPREKLQHLVDHFRLNKRYDQALVASLAQHLDSDIYWDEVTAVRFLGERECVDFEVAGTHNFVANGFITHNSTLLGNIALSYMSLVPAYKALYVSPSATQTKTFSNDRIKDPIETSPVLKRFTTSMLSSNILEKQFVNRSKLTMRYAFLNADRTRGIPAWLLELDEFQDILADNIPVIEQCTSHAPERWKRFIYAGTPKSLDNNIEVYWAKYSTQNEWVVPCGCKGGEGGRYWNVLGEKNIGKKGLICEGCGRLILPMADGAQWAAMQAFDPERKVSFEGYRIPQLMVPWKPWQEILLDYEHYPRDKFYNEVLGLSYDSGTRPLTRAQLIRCCNPEVTMAALDKYAALGKGQFVYAGIDWGSGEASYTVICLGTYVGAKFRVFFWHRFTGEDVEPVKQLQRIEELLRYFNVEVVGADYGYGHDRNDYLVRQFGPRKVQKFQYMARNKRKIHYDGQFGRWKCARTETMSDVFNSIKRRVVEFPRWEEFENPFGQDMLNIFSEENETLRQTQYKHSPDKPDDSFHALVYCLLASMTRQPRPDIIRPVQEKDGRQVAPFGTGPTYQG